MKKTIDLKLPIDMRLNLLSILAYIMEANDLGDFWKEEISLQGKEELIEALMGTGVAMVRLNKKFNVE